MKIAHSTFLGVEVPDNLDIFNIDKPNRPNELDPVAFTDDWSDNADLLGEYE